MENRRSSGILVHVSSLPSRYGIGDFGLEAYRFVDFLVQSGQRLWQVLPLGSTEKGNSPYTTFGSASGNPSLISPDLLKEYGLLTEDDLRDTPNFADDRVDFTKISEWKTHLLRKANNNFQKSGSPFQKQEFAGFCKGKSIWLEDYALFMALIHAYPDQQWMQWPQSLRQRERKTLEETRERLSEEILFHKFVQFVFFKQWAALKRYANDQNIKVIGDIPMYVAQNSADVWANQELFQLDPVTGAALFVAGVPPDYFSKTGQLWNNPIYDWDFLKKTNFDWWVKRIWETLNHFDLLRFDHFRGLEAHWSVRADEQSATNGRWIKTPGFALLRSIQEELGCLPIIAEDLGVISPEVNKLRDDFGLPGMKVLQFAFSTDSHNPFLPINHSPNSIVYTGTHDNNTTVGWFENDATEHERNYLRRYMGCESTHHIAWDFIRLAMSSVANQAVIPLQDILGLGANARMNTPSTPDGNWAWRFRKDDLKEEHADRLQTLAAIYGRVRLG